MKIIGITGKSGSGKSLLTEKLAKKLQCESVNIDQIGHKATNDEKIKKKLCDVFGNEILGQDKKVDRKKLGKMVFSSQKQMDILTEITWEYMAQELDKILAKEPKLIILEWALLPIDDKYWNKCDIKILMQADDKARKNKVIQRDQISEAYFLMRDANSIDYSKFKFDFIFDNDYQLETIEKITNVISKNS